MAPGSVAVWLPYTLPELSSTCFSSACSHLTTMAKLVMVCLPASFMCLFLTSASDCSLCRPASGKAAAKARAPLPPVKKADDYMADIDLPSSESEGELETIKKDDEEEPKEFRPHVSVPAPCT